MTSITATVLETAEAALKAETTARQELAAKLTSDDAVTGSLFLDVLTASAAARPWRDVLRLAERKGLTFALVAIRERVKTALLEEGENLSTSALTNEERRLHREAMRAFLRKTDTAAMRLQVEKVTAPKTTPAPAAASAAPAVTEPAPAAPARTYRPRPTKAQRTVLQLINTGGVFLREARIGQARAYGPQGPISIAIVRAVIRNGWADLDTSTSLYQGQAVTLTDTGRAHLPA